MSNSKNRSWQKTARLALTILVLITAGCDSTSTPSSNSEANKKRPSAEKKNKKPLEIEPLLPLLAQEPPPPVEGEKNAASPPLLVKPGHWTTTVQQMKSNYDDFVGQISTTLTDNRQRHLPLKHTNFTFQSTRPVALAKGRTKRIEGELYIPRQSTSKQIRATLRNRETGRNEAIGQPKLQKMPAYQYLVVVLAKEVSRYAFLKVTDAVRMPWEEESYESSQPHYRVTLADAKQKRLPLPENMLTWSSVAYLVWDEVDPEQLAPEQQLALVDWLHWGGRLIINGPDSLDTLRGSFLDKFLPAENAGPRSLSAANLRNWSAYWSRRDQGQRQPPLAPTTPFSGIKLKPRPGATELAGGSKLFYEKPVGRGTVVVSAIQLAERNLINWPGYDSFLNAALLRRPRRTFSEGPYGGLSTTWTDHPNRRLDAHFATGLRLFSRDATLQANPQPTEDPADPTIKTTVDPTASLGAWDDFNPVSTAARTALAEAAAVRVPAAGFVLACLGLYLMALVPLNWMVFRSLRRLEWAWIAAPVIAVLGTLVIVRQAQLDIGFVRSQTEIALLELQGTHPRGLLSRYTALYSSLSTTYDITYDQPTTLALPFPASQSGAKALDEKIWDVAFQKHSKTRLTGLAVSSASIKMVRSEQMFPLAGHLRLGKSSRGHAQLENRLGYNLRDVVVVRRFFERDGPAKYESRWIGELRDHDASVIGLIPLQLVKDIPHANERQQAANETLRSKIEVEALLKIAFQFPNDEDPPEQRRDEYRAVGLIDQVLPGTQIAPAASQIVGTTVVLAHLQYGDLPPPQPDTNSRNDIQTLKTP